MRKDKRVISALLVGIIVFSIYSVTSKNQMLTVNVEKNVQENDEVIEELSMAQKSDEVPEEFYLFEGIWRVGGYIDGAEESIYVDTESEEYKEVHLRLIARAGCMHGDWEDIRFMNRNIHQAYLKRIRI